MSCSFQTRNTISIIISCGPYHLLLTYLLAHLNQINYTELYIIRKRLIMIFLRLIKEKDKRFADFTQHNLIFTDDNLFSSRSDMHLACICLTLTLWKYQLAIEVIKFFKRIFFKTKKSKEYFNFYTVFILFYYYIFNLICSNLCLISLGPDQ